MLHIIILSVCAYSIVCVNLYIYICFTSRWLPPCVIFLVYSRAPFVPQPIYLYICTPPVINLALHYVGMVNN